MYRSSSKNVFKSSGELSEVYRDTFLIYKPLKRNTNQLTPLIPPSPIQRHFINNYNIVFTVILAKSNQRSTRTLPLKHREKDLRHTQHQDSPRGEEDCEPPRHSWSPSNCANASQKVSVDGLRELKCRTQMHARTHDQSFLR